MILFGLKANGRAVASSDYDILIIRDKIQERKLKRQIPDYCYGLDLKYGTYPYVFVLGKEEIHTLRANQPIFQTVLEKGIGAWL